RDHGDANRDALEAVAEPQPAGDGADRRATRALAGLAREGARRVDAQAPAGGVRLFFAAWPPPRTAAALHEWSKALRGRATPAEKIHLTLAFLGEADLEKATAAGRAVRA